jgi:hypothetical protein
MGFGLNAGLRQQVVVLTSLDNAAVLHHPSLIEAFQIDQPNRPW